MAILYAIIMRALQTTFITISIFLISCNSKSTESNKEAYPSKKTSEQKQNNLSCNCFDGIGSKKADKPILTFTFSNGQLVTVCGFVDKEMEGVTISEFNVFNCSNGKALVEYGATRICRLVEKKDTLQVSEYRYLPIAKNWEWELIKIGEQNITIKSDNIVVSELKPNVENFTIEEKKANDFLKTLLKAKGKGVGKNWEVEIAFLEALSLKGNDKAWKILKNYEDFIGHKTDGAIAEIWKDAVANVKWHKN